MILYHYTDEKGLQGITSSGKLLPSTSSRNPRDVRYGNGQYFTDVTPGMAMFKDEIFGPVLAVCEFGSLDEALDLANNSMYGLSSSIFTRNLSNARKYIDGIEAGLAHVNVHTGYKEPSMPFGGVKQSGAGLPENSRSGLEFFVDQKAVYLRS